MDRRWFGVAAALLVLTLISALAVGVDTSPAVAGDESSGPALGAPTPAQTKAMLDAGTARTFGEEPLTDPKAAATLPHSDLQRDEALELAEAVFQPELEAAGGILRELEPERFLSDHTVIVPASALPEPPGGDAAQEFVEDHPNQPVLVESLLPLRTESSAGQDEAVNLDLEPSGGELRPQNPLAEVGIPTQLGEGISLPGPEVGIEVAGAPGSLAPSNAEGRFAFYPEVAADTDLMVVPTPTGVETLTQLRSADAPTRTTYRLALPDGAELKESASGGAGVIEGGKPAVVVPAPTALDAAGEDVPAELSVEGDSITVVTTPGPATAFPVLVDPNYIVEGWRWTLNHDTMAAWAGNSTNWGAMQPVPYEIWAPSYPGLDLTSGFGGAANWGDNANWEYWVPRYKSDLATYGSAPTTWVLQLAAEGVLFLPYGSTANYPALVVGLVNPAIGWAPNAYVHYGGEGEMNSWGNWVVINNAGNATNVKGADMNMVTYEYEGPSKRRDFYMADAYISVVDEGAPQILELSPPARWMDTAAQPISYSFQDTGFGIRSARISYAGSNQSGWGFDLGCAGTATGPCPRVAKTGSTAALAYNPASLPTGKDVLSVTTGDILSGSEVGHSTSTNVVVKVDHTAPQATLSAGSLGATTYSIPVQTQDGSEAAPQSGIEKVSVYVDKVLKETRTNTCPTTGCPYTFNFTYQLALKGLTAGSHTVEVIAFDQLNHQHPATATFTLEAPNTVIDSGPEGLTSASTPVFSFHSSQSGSTFQCSVDGGTWENCSFGLYMTGKLADGPHTFEVKAINGAGLVDATPAKREFTVLGPPDTTIIFGPEGLTDLTRPVFRYESSDPEARFECKLDSGPFEPCNLIQTETLEEEPEEELAGGSHTFAVRAVNLLEVPDPTPATRSISVDSEPPTVEITNGPEGPTGEAQPTFDFTASGGSVSCYLESASEAEPTEDGEPPFEPCSTASSFTPGDTLSDGSYVFGVHAEDEAENDADETRLVVVDTSAPDTTITSAPASTTDDARPIIEFSASESGVTFRCRYDGEAFRACSGPGATDTPTTALTDGSHSFEVRATDPAGNVDQTPASTDFTLVTDGPQTSIDSGPEGAIATTEATFTYSTDEAAGFECSLDGASFASCPVLGKTYTGLAEGEHVFGVRGRNAAGIVDPTPARRAFVIDTSSPSTPTLDGPIVEQDGYGPHLEVEVDDGSDSSAGSRRSGIRSVQILLDGEVVRELEAECEADVCPSDFVRDAQLPYEKLLAVTAGSEVEVRAFDGKGHSSSATAEIKEPHDHVVEASEPEEVSARGLSASAEAVSGSDPDCKEKLDPLPDNRYNVKTGLASGTPHADLIVWRRGIKTMNGGDGCDVIIGGQGPTAIRGGKGDDIIRGGGSDDDLRGGADDDRIFGGIGDDHLYGGGGDDILDGGPGADVEKGEGDDDTLRGGQGADKLFGEDGTDTASFADALPPGYVEEDSDEQREGEKKLTIGNKAKAKAESRGVQHFPKPVSGVYVDLTHHIVYGGRLGEGGGNDEIRQDEHIIGSPFSDLIEGSGASYVDPGPGEDLVISTGAADVNDEPGDWVEGKPFKEAAKKDPKTVQVGEYTAAGETNVYVIGGNEADNLTVDPSGEAVRIRGGHLPAAKDATGCHSTDTGLACPDGKKLGALVVYGGQANDTINMEKEKPNLPGAIELDGGPGKDILRGGEEDELLVDGIQQGSGGGKEELRGNGGEDALAQGDGADMVLGGPAGDLFLNSGICEGDELYANLVNQPGSAIESDNAQFHALPNIGVWIDLESGKIGGKGEDNGKRFKNNCGGGRLDAFGFNNFEGSPRDDIVLGNANHNLIIGRGGRNTLYGRGGADRINAQNERADRKIDCGGQRGDQVQEDPIDVSSKVVVEKKYEGKLQESCRKIGGGHVYPDGWKPGGKKTSQGRGAPVAGSAVRSQGAALNVVEAGNEAFGSQESAVAATAEFHLDEESGTSAVNAIDEGAPTGTYMAKGSGPSEGSPGPVLAAESALLGEGEAEGEGGSSISLNGEDAYVDLSGQAGPEGDGQGYSFSLYVKFANAPGQREYIFSSANDGGDGAYLYRAADGSIVFTTSRIPGAPTVSSDGAVEGGWHQVVASLEGQTISLNVDGFPYELGYGSPVMPGPTAAPESLLGAGPGATDLLSGGLDELVSYEGVLSEAEIISLLAGSKAQLVEYLPMTAPETADEDGDGVPDGTDNCPTTSNPDQTDENEDGIGDACQTLDQDGDEVPDQSDDCPTVYDPDQVDTNGDGLGDACSDMPPTVTTGEATGVSATGAILHGTVTPGSLATTYRFEYGTTTGYGSISPVGAGKAAGQGVAPVAASQTVGGLKAGTTYHFRVVAESQGGVSEGEDETFTTASMDIAEALAAMPVTEPFDGSTASRERFKAWSALGLAEGSVANRKGVDTTTGWGLLEAFPRPAGAAHPITVEDSGPGIATIATMAANPTIAERYLSLWLAMPEPDFAIREGYELRLTETSAGVYTARLGRWMLGTLTTLGSKASHPVKVGSRLAIVEKEGEVSAWVDAGQGFTELLSAADTTFTEGRSAIEGAGDILRLKDFATGVLPTG